MRSHLEITYQQLFENEYNMQIFLMYGNFYERFLNGTFVPSVLNGLFLFYKDNLNLKFNFVGLGGLNVFFQQERKAIST